ncbi:MAG: putative thioredoxin [Betaproteobacteria bacterium]|nr:putative thioredoxin [Betaproteobacteria bacterium]
MGTHTVDVDKNNFDTIVIEGSKQAPVVVDFWAPWCAPCRALGPVLEKVADDYDGRFTLAKVNSDDNQEIAARYGVRGIPSVKAFIGGEVVDEFTGALPESGVRAFIERVVPSPSEELRDSAARVYAQTRDVQQALDLLSQAEKLDPKNEDARIDRVAILMDAGRHDEARKLIESLSPLARMDERVNALQARLDLAQGAAEAPSEAVLKERIARDENDLEARLQLAHQYVARQDYRSALDQLLEVVRRDRTYGKDVARKTMLKVFELLGNQGELVSEFRKKLATVMN